MLMGAVSRNEGAHSYEFSQTSELLECLMVRSRPWARRAASLSLPLAEGVGWVSRWFHLEVRQTRPEWLGATCDLQVLMEKEPQDTLYTRSRQQTMHIASSLW